MPSPDNESQENHQPNRRLNRGIDWRATVRTLLVQILVLLALAGAFIGYVDWSSDVVWAEFIEASKASVREPAHRPPSSIPVRAVKDQALCRPKG